MIKGIFLILVAINIVIGIFMVTKDEHSTNKSMQKIVTQINPNAVKIISDIKDGNYNIENTSDVSFSSDEVSTCVESNLVNESEVTFMQKELQNIMANVQTKISATTQSGSYLVFLPPNKPFKSQVTELRRLKISPLSSALVKGKTVVALGMFSDRPRAIEYADSLKLKGAKKLEIESTNEGSINIFWLRLPYASINEEGLLRKISSKYGIVTRFCQ